MSTAEFLASQSPADCVSSYSYFGSTLVNAVRDGDVPQERLDVSSREYLSAYPDVVLMDNCCAGHGHSHFGRLVGCTHLNNVSHALTSVLFVGTCWAKTRATRRPTSTPGSGCSGSTSTCKEITPGESDSDQSPNTHISEEAQLRCDMHTASSVPWARPLLSS